MEYDADEVKKIARELWIADSGADDEVWERFSAGNRWQALYLEKARRELAENRIAMLENVIAEARTELEKVKELLEEETEEVDTVVLSAGGMVIRGSKIRIRSVP